MREKILALHAAGKSYNQIKQELGCSKGTISYHCNPSQPAKTQARTRKRRANSATQKLENFRYRCAGPGRATSTQTPRKNRQNLVTHFIRNRPGAPLLTLKEVVERHPQPQCYLTGRNLSWEEPTKISFDHIVPTSRGGTSTLDNLGITCRPANQAKTDLMLDEFLTLCQEVLEHHGASVIWDTHE